MRFDLVVAADARRRGADGRALALLLETAAKLGYATALLPLGGPPPQPAAGFNPRIRTLIDQRQLAFLDPERPAEAGLALGWEASSFSGLARRPPRLRAQRALLRLDRPGLGPAQTLLTLATAVLGAPPTLVPADPFIAREIPDAAAEPWLPPVAMAAHVPTTARPDGPLMLGRHAGGGPDALEAAAPFGTVPKGSRLVLAEQAAIRFLRDPEAALTIVAQPHDLTDPSAWLAALDAWVMVTGASWLPWLPAALLEALAVARLLILPPALAAMLGADATYAEPAGVAAALAADRPPPARELVRTLASPGQLAKRLATELGPAAPRRTTLAVRRGRMRRRRVLMLSPNGIGMGHITRLLAIARRLPADIEPVFLSMSQGIGVVREMGFLAEYTPYQSASFEAPEKWAEHFKARLAETIAFYDPAAIVFDGNVPYQPLVDVRLAHPDRPFVWLRRGLWRPESGRRTIGRARHFDLIIEPGELAGAYDRGITANREGEAARVPPIVLLDSAELPTRAAARAELNLDPNRLCLIVQLGGRNNYDYRQVDSVLSERLGQRGDVQVLVVDWLIGENHANLPASFRRISSYPTARWLNAFDLAVSAAGYNSFHELTAACLPTIYVPNENPMMDEQESRALWAEHQGCALLARIHDPYRLAWALDRTLAEPTREAMRAAAGGLGTCDGAAEAARLLDEIVRTMPRDLRPERMPHALARD